MEDMQQKEETGNQTRQTSGERHSRWKYKAGGSLELRMEEARAWAGERNVGVPLRYPGRARGGAVVAA